MIKEGTLRVTKSNNSISFRVVRADGKGFNVSNNKFSPAILSDPARYDGSTVEYEEKSGQPDRVRPSGQPFDPPPPAAQPLNFQAQQLNDFHNPYNFTPALPRNLEELHFGDRPQISQDEFHLNRFSGRLRIKIEVKSPVLLPLTEGNDLNDNAHQTYPVRLKNGLPWMRPASVRGLIRSAYEIITNSRFGVFPEDHHSKRLAFRMDTREGLRLIPSRIENGKFKLYKGDSGIGNNGQPNGAAYAAWLPRYQHGRPSTVAAKYPDDSLPEHAESVKCWLELFQHHKWDQNSNRHVADFKYWRVRTIQRASDEKDSPIPDATPPGPKPHGSSWHQPLGRNLEFVTDGIVFISNANIKGKHDERVFFGRLDADPNREFAVNDRHKKMWVELIENYQEIHKKQLARRSEHHQRAEQYLGPNPGETAWSPHVYLTSARELSEGTLCYVRLSKDQRSVESVFPVMVARELFTASPWELLHASLRPAASLSELSSADRVFGWVAPSKVENDSPTASAASVRSLVRIGPIQCDSTAADSLEIFNSPLPLAILASPKPQQARFYVAENQSGLAQKPGISKSDAGYSMNANQPKALRGRKVYPHHRALPSSTWANPIEDRTQLNSTQEYRRPKLNNNEQTDDQNRSIEGWVKPGAFFSFDIFVENLSPVELGALFWLLNQPEGFHFRLGGGKPLGFGSIRLKLIESEVRTGDSLKQKCQQLDFEPATTPDLPGLIDEFKQALLKAYNRNDFESIPFIAAFIRSCEGFQDTLPIHYPRNSQRPNPRGESFKWFTQNEKPQNGRVCLSDLVADPGLKRY